jgi:class 3 adenylate cyclase
MVRAPLRLAYRRLGARYPRVALALQFQLTYLVVLGGVFLLKLYVALPTGQFLRILVVCEALTVIENAAAIAVAFRLVRPADAWLRGERTPATALSAWRALAALPRDFLRHRRGLPVLLNIVPISAYIAVELGGPFVSTFLALVGGTAIVLAYSVFLRFFAIELIMRPILEEVSLEVPAGSDLGRATVSLKWRLLVGLPAINVITGVVVAGLATNQPGIDRLGFGVVVAIAVAFTISLELSVLLLRSILEPIQDLRAGTERVAAGDLSVRVPVLGSDETGALAGSFNRMAAGMQERERLHEAFGAFVDPVLAERVLEEGTVLEGEEVEVTVLFLDIRDFTAFAERSSAREVVATLNAFYELVVPVLSRHGGHANKFVGDGLLGVFGAPQRRIDHADRAVAAALEIAALVHERYGGELRIGIGVNSGPVLAGTIGGGGRVDFTVIGDPVNTAARVEEVTRETGDVILITDATCCLLQRDHGGFAERPPAELKGKTERVRLHAPLAAAGAADGRGGGVLERG